MNRGPIDGGTCIKTLPLCLSRQGSRPQSLRVSSMRGRRRAILGAKHQQHILRAAEAGGEMGRVGLRMLATCSAAPRPVADDRLMLRDDLLLFPSLCCALLKAPRPQLRNAPDAVRATHLGRNCCCQGCGRGGCRTANAPAPRGSGGGCAS